VLSNGGFEAGLAVPPVRPASWYIGFEDEPMPAGAGTWSLDRERVVEGRCSLRLEPDQGIAVSQILHLPTGLTEGRELEVELWACHVHTGEPPVMAVLALNPSLPEPHPELGPGVAGGLVLAAEPAEGEWQRYGGSFTVSAPSSLVFVYLQAPGPGGSVWFDGVRIVADGWSPGPDPLPPGVAVPFAERGFQVGFTSEGPMDVSEQGRACLMRTAAAEADLVNVFFAVQWCRLDGDTCGSSTAHALDLERVRMARASGLGVALTFDFTHGQPEDAGTIGDLNPRPDGTSPGSLLEPEVREALADELLWLVDQARPEIVIVGIEADILGERHPEWWDAYVEMERSIYHAVKTRDAATHVTAYHRISWSVDEQGLLRPEAAALWRRLLGSLDSIAYSIYPNTALPGLSPAQLPSGYLTRPGDIAPDLPILVPELGAPVGSLSGYSEAEQVAWLHTMLVELGSRRLLALVWFQQYDRLYLEAPLWSQEAFNEIGLRDLAGTAKPALLLWRQVHALPRLQPAPRLPSARMDGVAAAWRISRP
jgi:hypothetical protein